MADKNYTYIHTMNRITDSKFPMQKYDAEQKKFVDVLDKDGNTIPMKQVSVSPKQMETLGHAIEKGGDDGIGKQYAQFSVPAYNVTDWKDKNGKLVTTKPDENGNTRQGFQVRLDADKDVYIQISEITGKGENGKNVYDYKKNPKIKVSVADIEKAFALPDKDKEQAAEAEAETPEAEAPELD